MRRNPYTLAALAAAAVPGLVPARTFGIVTSADDLDLAGVVGQDGRRVVVTSPASAAAGARMEKSVRVAESLSGTEVKDLVPGVLAFVGLPEGGRAAVTAAPPGRPLMFDAVTAGGPVTASLGTVLARIHAVRGYAAEATGVESFTAQALRDFHRSQVERVKEAEDLPPAVAQRWEQLLGDDGLWDFEPVFVHADLSEESFFVRGDGISAVQDWAAARIGDPAVDLAWLVATLEPEVFDQLYSEYLARLPSSPHPRLLERAQAVGEFAVADWLLHGLEAADEDIISDARGMLADLDADIAQLAREEAERAYEDLGPDRS